MLSRLENYENPIKNKTNNYIQSKSNHIIKNKIQNENTQLKKVKKI